MNKETLTFNKKSVSWGVLFVALVLVIAGIGSGLTHVFSGTTDTIIDNSGGWIAAYNGDNVTYYSATPSQLKEACWSFNGTTGGEIKVPPGYYEIDTLNISDKITIIGSGCLGNEDGHTGAGGTQFNLTENTDTILLSGGRLWNCKVYCDETFSGTAVNVTPIGADTGFYNNEYENVPNVIWNVNILRHKQNLNAGQANGTGLKLYSSDSVGAQHIGPGCGFNDITIMGFEYGLYLDAPGSPWNNGNNFNNIMFRSCKYHLYIETSGGGGNNFNNIQIQPDPDVTEEGLHVETNHSKFMNVMIWDWDTISDKISINVSGNNNYFSGWMKIQYMNNSGYSNRFDVVSSETNYFVYHPSNDRDATKINAEIGSLGGGEQAVLLFLPGTYDIDTTVNSVTREIEYVFCSGAHWVANSSFSDTYMMKIQDNEKIHGPGLLDGNNVAGIYAMRVYGDNVSISDLKIKDTTYGIRVDGIFCDYYDIIFHECNYGMQVITDNNTISMCTFDGSDNHGIQVTSGSDDTVISDNKFVDCANDISNSGKRTVINGISNNAGAPGAAGDWTSFTRENTFVWDTSNSNFYVYTNSTWNQITLT